MSAQYQTNATIDPENNNNDNSAMANPLNDSSAAPVMSKPDEEANQGAAVEAEGSMNEDPAGLNDTQQPRAPAEIEDEQVKMKKSQSRFLAICCTIMVIVVLGGIGIVFAIQITSLGGSDIASSGKSSDTEVFVWGSTDQPTDGTDKDNVPEEGKITTQEGVYSPKITQVLEFGASSESFNAEFPEQDKLLLPVGETDMRLTQIKYKVQKDKFNIDFRKSGDEDVEFLSGLQLGFSNGIQSKWFQHRSAMSNRDEKTIFLSPLATVKEISMAVVQNVGIVGLRMKSDTGETVVDKNWSDNKSNLIASYWKTQQVPEGMYIIGVKVNTSNDQGKDFIMRVGWQLWNPSNH